MRYKEFFLFGWPGVHRMDAGKRLLPVIISKPTPGATQVRRQRRTVRILHADGH